MQANLIVRTDASNDIREAINILRNMWNRHHAKNQGIMVITFMPYEPANFRLMQEVQEAEEDAERMRN